MSTLFPYTTLFRRGAFTFKRNMRAVCAHLLPVFCSLVANENPGRYRSREKVWPGGQGTVARPTLTRVSTTPVRGGADHPHRPVARNEVHPRPRQPGRCGMGWGQW